MQVATDSSQGDDRTVAISYDAAGNRTNYSSTSTAGGGGEGDGGPPPTPAYKARVIFNGRFFDSIVPN